MGAALHISVLYISTPRDALHRIAHHLSLYKCTLHPLFPYLRLFPQSTSVPDIPLSRTLSHSLFSSFLISHLNFRGNLPFAVCEMHVFGVRNSRCQRTRVSMHRSIYPSVSLQSTHDIVSTGLCIFMHSRHICVRAHPREEDRLGRASSWWPNLHILRR